MANLTAILLTYVLLHPQEQTVLLPAPQNTQSQPAVFQRQKHNHSRITQTRHHTALRSSQRIQQPKTHKGRRRYN